MRFCFYFLAQFRADNSSTSVSFEIDATVIVDPPEKKIREVVFPAPTWLQRQCFEDTNYCSGHGSCDTSGVCVCSANYYQESVACDSFCDGQVQETGNCRANKLYYIGGLIDSTSLIWEEREAAMRLALELINDNYDGWFDDDVPQVSLILEVDYSDCSTDISREKVILLNEWSMNASGNSLDALIGASCSGARYADIVRILHICESVRLFLIINILCFFFLIYVV
jgi:hypothetical protein